MTPVDPSELVPTGNPDLTLFIVMTILGFVIGAIGHLYRSTPVIVVGILMIMAATIVLPLIVFRGGG